MDFDDEKTTELELPTQPGLLKAPARAMGASSNVVRVDFVRRGRNAPASETTTAVVRRWFSDMPAFLDRFDLGASWTLRLMALLAVLLLSLLVL